MTQIKIGKIMAEAQKLAAVKDTRVCKRTGVPEEVLTGLKAGIVSDDEAALKFPRFCPDILDVSDIAY